MSELQYETLRRQAAEEQGRMDDLVQREALIGATWSSLTGDSPVAAAGALTGAEPLMGDPDEGIIPHDMGGDARGGDGQDGIGGAVGAAGLADLAGTRASVLSDPSDDGGDSWSDEEKDMYGAREQEVMLRGVVVPQGGTEDVEGEGGDVSATAHMNKHLLSSFFDHLSGMEGKMGDGREGKTGGMMGGMMGGMAFGGMMNRGPGPVFINPNDDSDDDDAGYGGGGEGGGGPIDSLGFGPGENVFESAAGMDGDVLGNEDDDDVYSDVYDGK
jgi:hypothetical protein